ncbi:DUF5719 family protein [Microbacterium abyssi]|uniref:DUF5719 family protein n=1 Tax=Microbacterium abyssi TaxID=2782166 RepID=UPI0018871EED|nr:DUF5719 family protein [Microbacterium sp. A18JL241]
MTQKRAIRVVATGARLLVGVAVAVGCVVGVTAAVAVPWPEIAGEPAQVAVTPTPGDTTLVCTGDFRAVGRNAEDAAQQVSAGTPEFTIDSSGPREESELVASDLPDVSGPRRLVGSAERGGAALIAAAESISIEETDLSGLAAAPCREARTESWLVGGTVETGTNDLIILSNPGDVTATATLVVYGIEQTATTTLVPAGTQLSVPLASIAAGAQEPVVRITAAGAPVRAVLQSSLIRTLDPSGIDLQDSAPAPQSELSFAGIQVATKSEDAGLTVLRLMATDQATRARITVRSGDAEVQQLNVPLEESTPTEMSLDGLDAGVYSIEIDADAPLVGAVRQTTRIGPGSDFAWTTAAEGIRGEILVAVPEGPRPRIHLVNTQDADATVTLAPAGGGDGEEIFVPAHGDALADVSADTAYSLSTDQQVQAALTLSGTDELAGWALSPGAAAQAPIIVYP